MAESPRINRKSRHKPSDSQYDFLPEVDLESILELRSNEEVYYKFYAFLIPSVGRKTFGKTLLQQPRTTKMLPQLAMRRLLCWSWKITGIVGLTCSITQDIKRDCHFCLKLLSDTYCSVDSIAWLIFLHALWFFLTTSFNFCITKNPYVFFIKLFITSYSHSCC